MNIIIVGCGKVGYTLVEQLSNEEHNIVVVDKNPDKVRYIADDLDTMGVVGNGVSYKTLQEAGIATADLVIAVTGSDEENLLCCVIAKKTSNCQTIARVRNPIYNEEIDDIICDGLELEEMGKIANQIAPSNVEDRIYNEIKELMK